MIDAENFEITLQQKFGLPGFRQGQKEIIASTLKGQDVLAVLPTGGGKSLCFQFPAILKNQLVIVVSPLIALMEDQVRGLRRMQIPAGCLHSGQSDAEKREVFRQIGEGGAFLLFMSPERIQKEGFHRWIKDKAVALFAIDEAHCVSQWGHDFRSEYAQLKVLKELRPDVPVLALTASATPLVLNDIARHLGLRSPSRHVHGFYRSNLYYQVETCLDDGEKLQWVEKAIAQNPQGRILVYCGTRKITEFLAQHLQKKFAGVGFYHAGLSSDQRSEIQKSYDEGALRILVATNAFGMGIDHPDVRLVVHYQMPANIDSLYQEMGRAGRDGLESTCLLLYSRKDKGLQSFFIQSSEAPPEIKSSRWNTLEALVSYSEGGECRHSEILTYYRDSQRIKTCGHCDVCQPVTDRRISRPQVFVPPVAAQAIRRPKGKAAPAQAEILDETQQRRFDLLRQWRRNKSQELDVPAFVIFGDRTLRELARANPQSLESLQAVYGFGEAKVERFGPELIKFLRLFDINSQSAHLPQDRGPELSP